MGSESEEEHGFEHRFLPCLKKGTVMYSCPEDLMCKVDQGSIQINDTTTSFVYLCTYRN